MTAHSPTLELYRRKLGAMLAEAHRRHIDDDDRCLTTIRSLEEHRAIIDAMTSAERQLATQWLNESARARIASRCGVSCEKVAAFLDWWWTVQSDLGRYLAAFESREPQPGRHSRSRVNGKTGSLNN
jgi:signal recognition particle GTPase